MHETSPELIDPPASAFDGVAGWYGVPPLPTHHVRRPRLIDLLDADDQASVVLVSAPAGSGKTSVVADWLTTRGDEEHIGWITFEESDDAFWPGFVGCVERLCPGIAFLALPYAAVPLDRDLRLMLTAAIADQPERLTVVVDGYEVVSAAVADDLDFLVRHSHGRLRLVIVTRADPILPLYRYRLEGSLAEIRMAELAFTEDEVADLLRRCGVALTPESVRALTARTKGWVAGLRFAALILLERDDPDLAVAEVVGDSGNIGEYLMTEVLAAQEPDVRTLLLRTSIPETLLPGLAEELGGRAATRTLAWLARVNAFVEPVPEHPGCFRYHPFFRELLVAELAYESPETFDHLQRLTAEWYARHGLMTAAVNHYAVLGAWEEAARQVVDETVVGQLLLGGGDSALARALQAVPDDLEDPSVAVVRATLALGGGDTECCDERLSRLTDESVSESDGEGVALALAVLRAVRASPDVEPAEAIILADAAGTALARPENRRRVERHPELEALVLAGKARATARLGDLARASELFAAGASASATARAEALLAGCLGHLALIDCVQGSPSRARSRATQALDVPVAAGGWIGDGSGPAQTALAWIDVERYDLAGASERVKAAESALSVSHDPVVEDLLAVVRARLRAARGDTAGALTILERVARAGRDQTRWPADLVRVESAHLWVLNGQPQQAKRELQGVRETGRADAALVLAAAQLEEGDDQAAADTLAAALVKDAPVGVRVSGLLVEAQRQLRTGSHGRARSALDRSLRLASTDQLCRPFREAPSGVRLLLNRDAALREGNRWLASPECAPQQGRLIPLQRSSASGAEVPSAESPVVEALTQKELEVLGHLSELLTTEEIASTMFISVNTIRTHVRSILRKLGVRRRNAAVRRARELDLLS